MDGAMDGGVRNEPMLLRIAALLVTLSLVAERTAARSFPVRFLVLAILYRAEAIARRFVAREAAALIAEAIDAGYPDARFPDLACLDEPAGLHYGAADASLLALRLRILAAVLGVFSDAEDFREERPAVFDGCSGGWPAVAAPGIGDASLPPLLFIFCRPATRRASRPP